MKLKVIAVKYKEFVYYAHIKGYNDVEVVYELSQATFFEQLKGSYALQHYLNYLDLQFGDSIMIIDVPTSIKDLMNVSIIDDKSISEEDILAMVRGDY